LVHHCVGFAAPPSCGSTTHERFGRLNFGLARHCSFSVMRKK
jgi:hypothetical protein